MKQQTSLDFYINEMNKLFRESGIHVQLPKEAQVFEQSKAMEKEQITNAYVSGSFDMAHTWYDPEKYYNETYGKK